MIKTFYEQLQQSITGDVSFPGEEIYKKASHMMLRTITPSVVVRPKTTKDVATTILFAKKNNIEIAIRSGGHNSIAARIPDGVLLLDMSAIASIEIIDKQKHIIRVGSGTLWYQVAEELGKDNLSISSGDTRTVGVGGLTTGGGIGWVVRKFGLAIDQLVSAEVVTADGKIVTASTTENPDLFWAIRGGGSNFGVVTYFDFVAHELEGIYAGSITYSLKDTATILKGWRDVMRNAPTELTTMLLVLPPFGPDNPASIMITICYAGIDEKKANAAIAPLLTFGEVIKKDINRKAYSDVLEDAMVPPGKRPVVNSTFCKEFTDTCIETIAKFCEQQSPILQIRYIAGVMKTPPNGETAFPYRDSEVLIVHPVFVEPNASESEIEKALIMWRAIEPYGRGPYLNIISEDTGKELAQAFPPETLKRLERVKAIYDPDNFFRNNYNINPQKSHKLSA